MGRKKSGNDTGDCPKDSWQLMRSNVFEVGIDVDVDMHQWENVVNQLS